MQPNNSVIIYRSQTEANTDQFMNQIVFPFIYEHWLGIVLVVAALAVGGIMWSALTKRRY